jgi:hypothetical protein
MVTRFPNLKIPTYQVGAMIPFFDARIEAGWAMLSSRTSASSIANETVLEPRGLNREHRSLVPQ